MPTRRSASSRPRVRYHAWKPEREWCAVDTDDSSPPPPPADSRCSVRVAGAGDLAAVAALVDRTFDEAEGYFLAEPRHSEPELRQAMESAGSTVFLADHGWVWSPPVCVGAVRVDVPSGSPEAYMAMLAVAPEQQRQGIGRLLVDQAEALAHSKGCKGMNLHASSCRAPVLRFYEALGYAVVGAEQLPEQVSHLVRPEHNTPEQPFLTTHFRKELAGLEPTPQAAASIAASEAAADKAHAERAAVQAAEAAEVAHAEAAALAEAAMAAEMAAKRARDRAAAAAAVAAAADSEANAAMARAEAAAKEAFNRAEEDRVAGMLNVRPRAAAAARAAAEATGSGSAFRDGTGAEESPIVITQKAAAGADADMAEDDDDDDDDDGNE
eukprot:COSAG06_NODE_2802_length_6261_cov_6.591853_3_plen_382_part_00